jgi:hypothetical protein
LGRPPPSLIGFFREHALVPVPGVATPHSYRRYPLPRKEGVNTGLPVIKIW